MKMPFLKISSFSYLFFFITAMCGFIYEIIWMHLFSLVLGNNIYTQVAVLIIFIIGVALGALISSRVADRLVKPMRSYAFLTLIMSFLAFLSPWVISATEPIFRIIYQNYQSYSYQVNALMFILCSLVLIFPAALLGATMPILVSSSVGDSKGAGFRAGEFYSIGGFGASLGAILAGFILLPYLGYNTTLDIIVSINILVSIAAYLIGIKEGPRILEKPKDMPDKPNNRHRKIIIAILFFSAFCGVVYQVAMTRILILIFDTTIYSVTVILASYIFAIASGCMISLPLKNILRDRFLLLSIAQILFSVSLLIVAAFVGELPAYIEKFSLLSPNSFIKYRLVQFVLVLMMFLLSASYIGFIFTLGGRVFMKNPGAAGYDINRVYIVNVAGVVIGLLTVVFVFIPKFGIMNTILMIAAISMLIGVVIIFYTRLSVLKRLAVSSAVIIILPPLFLIIPSWDNNLMVNSLILRKNNVYGNEADFLGSKASPKEYMATIYYKEGAVSTVSVTKRDDGVLSLKIDGSEVATTGASLITQELLAHIALMLHKDPKDILLIGLGSGASLEAVVSHSVERIDCVEVSKEVIEATQFFRDVNKEAILDWRVKLLPVDGRAHIELSGLKYDVIIATPAEPWIYGTSGFFTREYFNSARMGLRDDGLMVQWVNGNRLSEKDFRTIVRTFLEAFPYASLWEVDRVGGDYLLLGSTKKLSFDYQKMKERLNIELVMHGLEKVGVTSLATIFKYFTMDDDNMREYSWDAAINSDDNSYLEFSSAREILKKIRPIKHKINDYRSPPLPLLSNINRDEIENINKVYMAGSYKRNAEEIIETGGDIDKAIKELERAMTLVPDNRDTAWSISKIYLTIARIYAERSLDEAIKLYKKALELYPAYSETWYFIGSAYYSKGMYNEAVRSLKEAASLSPMSPHIHKALSFAYKKSGEEGLAAKEYEAAIKLMRSVENISQ
ncbi:MAG TPA: hypothetical protein DHU69_07005 [Deltaproteobacteria bacterium]|nr:hypothetical protein [Deltaproteobacteria bacterium]